MLAYDVMARGKGGAGDGRRRKRIEERKRSKDVNAQHEANKG